MRFQKISAILWFIVLVSCRSNGPKTFITEKPIAIDSSDFRIIEQQFHYEGIDVPSSFLGGLTPRLPLAEVYSFGVKDKCIWQSQGMLLTSNSLIVKSNSTFILIDTEEKFKETFAPINSEQEAVSYVAYLTRAYPKYDISRKFRYRLYASEFPSTYAKKINGGFEVLLHDKKEFGCGPHPCFYKIFRVTDAGEITLFQTVKMFEDPAEDNLCVD